MPVSLCVVKVIVALVFVGTGDCLAKSVVKRKLDDYAGNEAPNRSDSRILQNSTYIENGRGFFGPSLLSWGKVLNFFPVGGERECQPSRFTVARAGICLNQYDCRQRDGRAAGDCAHGLGVCCIFEVTCGGVVQNNLTYFTSPGFPELWGGQKECAITIEKTHAGITQLKIDFVHFTIGQPNRTTGECDEDAMFLGEGENRFVICGQNHGQHLYYTFPSNSESREEEELGGARGMRLVIRSRGEGPRLWLLRLALLPLAHAAPHGCLQYHTAVNGTIKTFNYASNGRHLSRQRYRVCVRRGAGACAVRYWPCGPRAFRIADPGLSYTDMMQQVQLMPAVADDEMLEEGSGRDPNMAPVVESSAPSPGLWDRRRRARTWPWGRWAPMPRRGRRRCADRLTIPCDDDFLVASSSYISGVCDPHHCGDSFCPGHEDQCWVETAVAPFAVAVNFGPPTPKGDPEDNIGACLRYMLLPCDT